MVLTFSTTNMAALHMSVRKYSNLREDILPRLRTFGVWVWCFSPCSAADILFTTTILRPSSQKSEAGSSRFRTAFLRRENVYSTLYYERIHAKDWQQKSCLIIPGSTRTLTMSYLLGWTAWGTTRWFPKRLRKPPLRPLPLNCSYSFLYHVWSFSIFSDMFWVSASNSV